MLSVDNAAFSSQTVSVALFSAGEEVLHSGNVPNISSRIVLIVGDSHAPVVAHQKSNVGKQHAEHSLPGLQRK